MEHKRNIYAMQQRSAKNGAITFLLVRMSLNIGRTSSHNSWMLLLSWCLIVGLTLDFNVCLVSVMHT